MRARQAATRAVRAPTRVPVPRGARPAPRARRQAAARRAATQPALRTRRAPPAPPSRAATSAATASKARPAERGPRRARATLLLQPTQANAQSRARAGSTSLDLTAIPAQQAHTRPAARPRTASRAARAPTRARAPQVATRAAPAPIRAPAPRAARAVRRARRQAVARRAAQTAVRLAHTTQVLTDTATTAMPDPTSLGPRAIPAPPANTHRRATRPRATRAALEHSPPKAQQAARPARRARRRAAARRAATQPALRTRRAPLAPPSRAAFFAALATKARPAERGPRRARATHTLRLSRANALSRARAGSTSLDLAAIPA